MRRLERVALEQGGLITLAILALYLWMAPTTVVYGDNAELSALGANGGVAHPSGYPLYLLWLRAWSWLPAASPAHAASLATALLAALLALVLHAACRAWGARPLAATFAVGLMAAGPVALRMHSEAEVFAMNGLIAALVVWLAADKGPLRGRRRVIALGLVAGLGLSNHLTCVLVAPLGLYGAWRGIVEDKRSRVTNAALAIAGLAVGLLPYAYLFVARDTQLSWGTIDSVGDLVRHVLRSDYGGPGQFSPAGTSEPNVGENFVALIATLGRAYLWLPALAGLAALAMFSVRTDRGAPRVAWGCFAASVVLAGPLLASRFNTHPVGTNLYVTQRFHLLAMLLLAVPIAVAIDRAFERAAKGREIPARWRGLSALVTLVGFIAAAAPSMPYVARMHSPAIQRGMENMLTTLPENAIVIGSSDAFHFGLGYLQSALGLRPDVATITTVQLGLPHYRAKVLSKTGIVVVGEPGPPGTKPKVSTLKIAEQALATGRPLFIDPLQRAIGTGLPTYPYGLLFRVLPAGTKLPSVGELFAINKELYGRYVFGYEFPSTDDQLAADFHQLYARTWEIIAKELEARRMLEELAFARGMIAELAPRTP